MGAQSSSLWCVCVCAFTKFFHVHSCVCNFKHLCLWVCLWTCMCMYELHGLVFVCPVLSGVMMRLLFITLVVHTSAVMRKPVKWNTAQLLYIRWHQGNLPYLFNKADITHYALLCKLPSYTHTYTHIHTWICWCKMGDKKWGEKGVKKEILDIYPCSCIHVHSCYFQGCSQHESVCNTEQK